MDKIKSIIASAAGKKPGPPVPPRPSPAAVQKALEKTRIQVPSGFPPVKPPIVHGRTIIFSSSTNINNEHADHQPRFNNVSCEIKCFDTKTDDSSASVANVALQNGNNARISGNCVDVKTVDVEATRVILHHKSPVPKPRTSPTVKNDHRVSTVTITSMNNDFEMNSYANPPMRTQTLPSPMKTHRNRDDELKQKLLNEMVERSAIVEASNPHVRYRPNVLKRSSSFDILNESLGDSAKNDKKVIFHEMLISELSEMRRDTNLRRSAAKSSPDISPNGNLNIFEIGDRKSFTFVSLDDSGVEDEEKMDDFSSSGVGDSWDSCKEMENRINTTLPGLPPLPKSLSGIDSAQNKSQSQFIPFRPSSQQNQNSNLDNQFMILKREMNGLRQLDLSLLSQLWALNESIQEFRTMLQDQEQLPPQSPSQSNSDLNSLASDDDDETSNDERQTGKLIINGVTTSVTSIKDFDKRTSKLIIEDMHQKLEKQIQRMRIAPPAPPTRKPPINVQSRMKI